MPDCSVVIRCYNEEEHIGRLLTGIEEQTLDDVEIVLVDSGSTDGTLAIASQYDPKIVYISPDEFTFGRALNKGIEAASAPIIVNASAHVYPVYDDWLETLIEPFEADDVACVYGKQRGAKQTEYAEHQIFHTWFPDERDEDQDEPFCNNANAAIRRELWEQMPYDEKLTGLEDIDWAKRAQERGYRIVYEPDAVIIHVHDETPKQTYNRYKREAIALSEIFPEEEMTFLDFLQLLTSNVASDLRHAREDEVLLDELTDIVKFRFLQFWGAYQGFNFSGPVTRELRDRFYYTRDQHDPNPEEGETENRDDRVIHYEEPLHDPPQRELEPTQKGDKA